MVVAGTADVGVQDRRAVRGERRRLAIEPVLDDGGDALVIERADLDCSDRDSLGPSSIDAAIYFLDAEAGPEPLLRFSPPGQYGDDERLGIGAYLASRSQ